MWGDCGIPDNTVMHLLIPFASCSAPASRLALRDAKLPHLKKLLSRLGAVRLDAAADDTRSPPHERALAQALGLGASDGCIAWAAWHALQTGRADETDRNAAWGFVTPCHWRVGQDHITMDSPQTLNLQEDESRALLAAMQPYFEEDGIGLGFESPTRWLARGEVFRGLATASLDRVTGRDIDAWMPKSAPAATLRRLQNEMQMLLYTHPVNDARTERGLPPVNSFWVHGTGALPASAVPPDTPDTPDTPIVPRCLADAALREDWPAWTQAWQQLDATECAALLAALDQPGPPGRATLTLCGERGAQTFEAAPRGMLARISGIFGHQPLSNLCKQL